MSKSTAPPPYDEYANFQPLQVEVTRDFEMALREFKSLVQKSKILGLVKQKQVYEKPSEKKRRKAREAQERARMLENRTEMIASGEWNRRQKKKEDKHKSQMKKYQQQAQDMLDV